jgi:hypothetical protein
LDRLQWQVLKGARGGFVSTAIELPSHLVAVDRTTVSLSANVRLAEGVNISDHVLVMIGVSQNVLSVTSFSSVVNNV